MPTIEKHNVEFKESWREEFLKTLCAFANTKGGTLMVGITDAGKAKGLADKKKLLEEIPNKIKEHLSVVAEVQPKKKDGKDYISINVKPYDSPISFKGKYYTRSGSTTQELNGAELHRFLLHKSNTPWETVTVDEATLADIDEKVLAKFKELAKEKSLPSAKEKTASSLLAKLHLTEKGKLTRAGILLFGKNPQQFFPGSFIKVGRFNKEGDLLSGEEVKGNLFNQAEQVLEILKNKYLVAEVQIKGLYRTESLEYPESAIREALINAIAHKDYSGSHIQIKVYPDKLTFWNPGVLPQDLTVALLKKDHPSKPRNTHIANIFHDAGLIERWGHGTVKMVRDCVKAGLPEPTFEENAGGMLVTLPKDTYSEEYLNKKGLNERQIKGVLHVKEYGSISNNEYQEITGAIKRTASRDLTELVEKSLLIKTGSTGKGTVYTLRGHKGDKGDIRGTTRGQKEELDVLDSKLVMLERELRKTDPNDTIKGQLDKKIFFEIYDGWLSDLLRKAIIITQKFNRFFAESRHHLLAINGYWSVQFSDEDPNTILQNYREQGINNKNGGLENRYVIVQISLNYQSFRTAGLKTFNCGYYLEIVFSAIGYKIFLSDTSSGGSAQNGTPEVENLLHKAPTQKQINSICEKLGNEILAQIENKRAALKG
jgi:ATP-dependent DNA helicase RecG